MNKLAVVLLFVASFLLAGAADAANPKRRTRNQNRVGPYGAAMAGMSQYTSDHSQDEADIINFLATTGFPSQNFSASSEEDDIGYQLAFGYRFNRYFSAEIALAQFGSTATTGRAELDLGDGFVPTSVTTKFSVGGPLFSAVGFLPLNDKCELFARAGVLLASSENEISTRIDGENAGAGSAKGDSSNGVIGAGFAWHINQVYTVRAEYMHFLDEVGQRDRTGKEELKHFNIGVLIRF